MLSCKDVGDLLSAYYDGELGVAASKQIEEHLDVCEDCKKEIEDIRNLSREIKTLEFPMADEAFALTLSKRLAEQTQKTKLHMAGVWKKIRPYAAVAACFVVALGIYAAHDRGYVTPNDAFEYTMLSEPENTPLPTGDISESTSTDENMPEVSAQTPEPRAVADAGGAARATNERSEDETPKPTLSPKVSSVDENKITNAALPVTANNTEPSVPVTPAPTPKNESVTPGQTPALTDAPEAREIPKPSALEPTEKPDGKNVSSGGGGGGGSSGASAVGITVRFKLTDNSKKDDICNVLSSYGDVLERDGYMRAKILSANYDAALATLRSMGALSELSQKGKNGEYGFIEIEYENTAE